MGLTPQHQRRCTSRLRRRRPATGTGAVALARIAAGGGGWSFAPDYPPAGAELFRGGAVANSGGYSNSTSDSLINQTLTSNNMQAMHSWQDSLSAQLPMICPPQADCQCSEIANNLKGAYPLSPTLSINPEDWYFVK
jgi:peptide/nickel transport system substrate-binding protein